MLVVHVVIKAVRMLFAAAAARQQLPGRQAPAYTCHAGMSV